ncbi:MAG TPA: Wzz/FepE/Etk N-terminal domain-containing protein [Terriglobales bacterium]|nr:Wzz/FepE/Etk N-terminal domain-containing protein [Terriglobales bacterium]
MMEELDDQKSGQGFDDYWAIVVRRKWWILGPLFFGWLIVFASAWFLPPTYTSESTVLVEPPKVPSNLVEPNVQVDLADRVQSMSTQVLSRTRLLNLIQRFNLYPGYASSPDDQVEKMRDDIKMELIHGESNISGKEELVAFKVSYKAPTPDVAQKVTIALTSFFVDENVRASQEQSEATTLFLDSQVRALGQTLADEEAKVRAFESEHDGTLPQQLDSNIHILQGIQQQMQAAQSARERALEQQTYLNSLQAQYQNVSDTGIAPQSVDEQLNSARTSLAAMETRYTDEHPDVVKLKETIASLEKLKKQMADEERDKMETGSSPAAVKQNNAMLQLKTQMKLNREEIDKDTQQLQRLQQEAQVYQARLNATPAVEAQMADMMRDYGNMKKEYQDLMAKKETSALATSLERQQQGAQFRVIDPPSLPDKPSFPDRFKFSLAAVGTGFALALLCGFGSEFLDDRIRGEQALTDTVNLPILGEIPPLSTAKELRRARWAPRLALVAAILCLILLPSGVLYAFYWG